MDDQQKEKCYSEVIAKLEDSFNTQEFETPQNIYNVAITELANIPYFNWTGIYLVAGHELILNSFIGAKTEHLRIPIGKGVCGSAVAEGIDKVIEDVREESNYLACSLSTRSEIVVLIEFEGHIIGQIDVDSDEVSAFNETDRIYIRKIAKMIVNQLRVLGPATL